MRFDIFFKSKLPSTFYDPSTSLKLTNIISQYRKQFFFFGISTSRLIPSSLCSSEIERTPPGAHFDRLSHYLMRSRNRYSSKRLISPLVYTYIRVTCHLAEKFAAISAHTYDLQHNTKDAFVP